MTMVPELASRWCDWCEEYNVTACFFGHLHENQDFLVERTRMLVTASINWNFPLDVEPTPDDFRRPWGGYHLIRVDDGGIEAIWRPLG